MNHYAELPGAIASLPRCKGAGTDRWTALCPAHADRTPSLSIGLGREQQYIFKCHAGCAAEDIVRLLGFAMEDLWPDEVLPSVTLTGLKERTYSNGHDTSMSTQGMASQPQVAASPTPVTLRRVQAPQGTHDFLAHYSDDPTQTFVHKRTDDGHGGKTIWWEPRGVDMKRLALFAPGPTLAPVVVCEGERAAMHVQGDDFSAVATWGSTTPVSDDALAVLKGKSVILWPDNDDTGKAHMEALAMRIALIASSLHIVHIPEGAEKGWDAGDVKPGEDINAILATAEKWVPTQPLPPHFAPPDLGPMDAFDLLELQLDPLKFAIPGLLPEGLGVIGSPPKVGKSLLAYQMAVEMVLGGDVLGLTPELRPVRYYALEDGRRRSQERVRGLINGRRWQRGLKLVWTAPRLGGPFETEVNEWLDDNQFGVVIVDVLSKVRPPGGRGNAYDEDYAVLTPLHDVAKAHPGSVILLITHDRKAGSDDWMTRITGTRGVTGMADFVIFIARKREDTVGRIHVTGRDIEDLSYGVEFTIGGWRLASAQLLIAQKSPTRVTMWNFINAHGPASPAAIALGTGLAVDVVRHRLVDMLKDGDIKSTPKGYVVPDEGLGL